MSRPSTHDRDTAIEAAMGLFWRKGYHATSLKDLEATLDMRPGSIYAAFKSKRALYLATLDRYSDDAVAGIRAMAAELGSPLAALAAFMRHYGRPESAGSGQYACMVVKGMLDAPAEVDTPGDEAIGQATRRHLDRMAVEIRTLFEAAREGGEIAADSDPTRLARRYQMMLTALRVEAQRTMCDPTMADVAEDMAREIEALRRRPG